MTKHLTLAASMLALVGLTGPSVAGLPCTKVSSDGTKLMCYCQPGASPGSDRCRCFVVAIDESGVVVW